MSADGATEQGPDEGATRSADDATLLRTAGARARTGAERWNSAIPVESSRDLRGAIRRLGRILGREGRLIGVAGACAAGGSVLVAIGPRLLGSVLDVIVAGVQHGRVDSATLHRRLWLLVAVYSVAWVLGHVQSRLLTGAVQRTMYRLREDVEAKLHRLPLPYVDRHSSGDLLSRVTNDIDNLAQSLQQSINQILSSVLLVLAVTVMMFTISPTLTLVALVAVPITMWVSKRIAKRARPGFLQQWAATGELNSLAQEGIAGHAVITTFGRQQDVIRRFDEENDRLESVGWSAQFVSSLMQPLGVLLGNLQFVSVAVVGGMQVASGRITLGGMQAMIQYVRLFSQPVQQVATMTATLQSGLASLERVAELLDADEEPVQAPLPHEAGVTAGRVVFENVHFSYAPEKPLISGLDLVVEPGRTIAIVGPTGAGKTTLVNLLLRFYDLDAGRITIDGIDIATMPRRQLRSRMGMVLQDAWLFGGTIRDNLRYGNPSATEEQLLDAARVTYVDRFVHSLPHGYDTMVDEDAENLSAGERQLITIARAHLSDPAILILDEATSAVDTRTEMLIQDAMNALRSSRTSFVIAHRLSTIRNADTIIVMDGGRIVQHGSHDELIAAGGAYADLYGAQYAGEAT
jgi:ATP-binding cassette subfamily B protein